MTTPAINRNVKTYGKGDVWQVSTPYPNGRLMGTLDVAKSRDMRKRPASQSRPIVHGFREMTNWSHAWGHGSTNGGSTQFTAKSPSEFIKSERYENGSYWTKNCLDRPAAPEVPSNLENMALVKALNAITDDTWNLGMFLAEIDQTYHMVGSTAAKIACQVKAFRASNPKRIWRRIRKFEGTKHWRKVPQSWLALQYGWVPLMQDVMGALGEIDKLGQERFPLVHVKGSAKGDLSRDIHFSGQYAASATYRQNWEFKCKVHLYYKLRDAALARLSALGLVNPASIIWERMMFSFVVDWFLPIGPWLNSLTAASGFDFQAGCFSVYATCTEEFISGGTEANTPWGAARCGPYIDNFRTKWEEGFASRKVYTSSPVPGIYYKNPLSTRHMLNGIALLIQAFR